MYAECEKKNEIEFEDVAMHSRWFRALVLANQRSEGIVKIEIHFAIFVIFVILHETRRNFVIIFSCKNYSLEMNLKPKYSIFQEILSCFNREMDFYLTTSPSLFPPFQITWLYAESNDLTLT